VTVLVLGGTAEARSLAELLDSNGVDFVSSLAGRVRGRGCQSARSGSAASEGSKGWLRS
jgi:precorrin-6A/cobalt-precorrin-6A reductase